MTETPKTFYSRRIAECGDAIAGLQRTAARLSRGRLLSFVAALVSGFLLSRAGHQTAAIISFAALAALFATLVAWNRRVRAAVDRYRRISSVNQRGRDRIEGRWSQCADSGEAFTDREHPYSIDLDVFGRHSLYQWLCSAHTPAGKRLLGTALAGPLKSGEAIYRTQASVNELSGDIRWLQEFEAEGLMTEELPDPREAIEWMEDGRYLFSSALRSAALFAVSVAVPILAAMLLVQFGFPFLLPAAVAANLIIYGMVMHRTGRVLSLLERHAPGLGPYAQLLGHVERRVFASPRLRELRSGLGIGSGKPASQGVKRLQHLVPWVEVRHSPMVTVLLNGLFLWDLHAVRVFERWKREHGPRFGEWLRIVGEFEVLAGFAAIRFENPAWTFPLISEAKCVLETADLGHPLIHESKRVGNDVQMRSPGSVLILTGSNMSGKTTLLRTVGVNLVLAYCGAPVCAKSMTCSSMDIWTSMRLTDDLERGISTFYAQLLRIKVILDHARKGPVLALLDEIFGGTNSKDRNEAAVAVLKKIAAMDTLTLMSTHDLALETLAREDPSRFFNAHFQETYAGDRIHFDYLLRPGPAQSSNALYLLRSMGLDG